jgi:hypothetical protein
VDSQIERQEHQTKILTVLLMKVNYQGWRVG